jgi:hypothetical protein
VLFIIAETCRGDSRKASISMVELQMLSGQKRTSMSNAVNKLIALGYLNRLTTPNQHKAASYEILPGACAASRTRTDDEHVQIAAGACSDSRTREAEHVHISAGACADSRTYPIIPVVTTEVNNPEGDRHTQSADSANTGNETLQHPPSCTQGQHTN